MGLAGRSVLARPDAGASVRRRPDRLIVCELRHRSPVVNFRPLRERSFVTSCVIIFFAYAVLYGASTSLPGLLQSLFGYDALSAGLVMSPAGQFPVPAPRPRASVLLLNRREHRPGTGSVSLALDV